MLVVFMRYCTTEDYVEQFLFCRPFSKHATGERMFKQIPS